VFAALYFTGNTYFNRSMRIWAEKKFKLKLNEFGLYHLGTDQSALLEPQTEKEVFDRLEMKWKEPTERDSFDAVESKLLEELEAKRPRT
jgi:DNA polymerase/3'-5' exonuclease PolX